MNGQNGKVAGNSGVLKSQRAPRVRDLSDSGELYEVTKHSVKVHLLSGKFYELFLITKSLLCLKTYFQWTQNNGKSVFIFLLQIREIVLVMVP